MAVRDTMYAMYKTRPDYIPGIGDSFFYDSSPHRSYYRTSMYTVMELHGADMIAKQMIVQRYEPYFRVDYNREEMVTIDNQYHVYLAIKIMDKDNCIFNSMPDSINLIGRKARVHSYSDPYKSHVLVADTVGYYTTRYKCSGAVMSGYVDLVHKEPIGISQVHELSGKITCSNCQGSFNKWTAAQ